MQVQYDKISVALWQVYFFFIFFLNVNTKESYISTTFVNVQKWFSIFDSDKGVLFYGGRWV